jgi:sugar lactone lactonase YvrE
LTISGPGATNLAISGANASEVFQVDAGVAAVISGVTIENGSNSAGGGILNVGVLTVSNSTLSSNSAGSGGGGILNVGVLTVSNSTLSGNSTPSGIGGGIFNVGVLTVSNSTLSGNSSVASGGGIFSQGTLALSNSTLTGNSASSGGGVFNQGALALSDSTLSSNSAGSGGGIYNQGTLALKSTLLAGQPLGGNCANYDSATSDGYNLSDDSSCSFFGPSDFNNVAPPAVGLDPKGLENNGGPTQTIAILDTGLAFEAIPLSACTDFSGNLVPTDQRGITRPQGSACDIGAFELVQVPTANVCPAGQTTPAPCSYPITLQYNIPPGTAFGASPVKVLTQGIPNLDFTLASTTCTGSPANCIVNITFAPLAPGLRVGAVQLSDSSGNPVASNLISGIGQGPAIAFGPSVQTTVGSGLHQPFGVAVDGAGDVFIADTLNSRVLEVPAGGGPQTTVGSGLWYPTGVAVDGAGNVFIASEGNNLVVEVPAGGGAQTTLGSGLSTPYDVAVDGAGDVFIADANNNRVVEVPAGGGTQTTVPASGLNQPLGVGVDGAGDVFIADTGNSRVVEVPAGGGAQTTVGSGLIWPYGVAVDGAGDVFIGSAGNNQVVEVPAGGGAQTIVGSGLMYPTGVAVDGAGDVFITDAENDRVVTVQRSQPPALSFASTAVGSTSSDSPQSVIIQNIGNQPLNAITPGLVVVGPNFLQIAGSGTPADCNGSFALTPGATCNLSISFEPQSAGNLTSTATFTDNALNASPSANQSIALQGAGTVTMASQTITFTQFPPASALYSNSFAVAASASSGLAVAFTSTGSCSNMGGTYTMTSGSGSCSVVANQAGNGNYSPAPQVTQTVIAIPLSQSVTFTVPAPATAKSGDIFTVAATGGASGNPVTFSVGAGSVCTISGATYTMTSDTGTCSVIANQLGTINYAPAPQVTETVTAVKTVKKVAPTVTFTGALTSAAYLSTFTIATTQNSGITPVITSMTGAVCTVSSGTVTMKKGTGTCTVKASWATNDYYLAASLEQSTTGTLLGTTSTITNTIPQATHPLKVEVYFTVANGMNAVTGNVTVTAAPGGQTCTGTVTSGKCLLTFPAAEPTILTATYEGNADDSTSTSASYSLTVY